MIVMQTDRDPRSVERQVESLLAGLPSYYGGSTVGSIDLPEKGRLGLEIQPAGDGSDLWVQAEVSWQACRTCRNRLQQLRVAREGAARQLRGLIEELRRCHCEPPSPGSPVTSHLRLGTGSSRRGRIRVVDPRPSPSDRPRIAVKSPGRSRAPEDAGSGAVRAEGQMARAAATSRYLLPDGGEVEVTFTPDALRDLLDHCRQSNHHGREVAGLLVGYSRVGPTPLDCQVVVTDLLRARETESSESRVALGPEVWLQFEAQFESRFAPQHKRRLGWYHTHPTQGVFFSHQDLDAHTLFTQRDQFAVVVDPQSGEASLFYWRDSRSRTLGEPAPLVLDPEARAWSCPATAEEGPAIEPARPALLLLGTALLTALVASLLFAPRWVVALTILFALVAWALAAGISGRLTKLVRTVASLPRKIHLRVRRSLVLALGAGLVGLLVGVALRSELLSAAGSAWRRVTRGDPMPVEAEQVGPSEAGSVEAQKAAREPAPPPAAAEFGPPADAEKPLSAAGAGGAQVAVSGAVETEPVVLEVMDASATVVIRSGDSSVTVTKDRYELSLGSGERLMTTILGSKVFANQFNKEVQALQSAVGVDNPNGVYGPHTLKLFVYYVEKLLAESADGTATLDIGPPGSDFRRLSIRRVPPGDPS